MSDIVPCLIFFWHSYTVYVVLLIPCITISRETLCLIFYLVRVVTFLISLSEDNHNSK